jgi:voltage-gated potassium channel
MVFLAVLFLFVLIAPLASSLSPSQTAALHVLDLVIWACFALEYSMRLYLALERWKYVRSHVLDLIVVAVPFVRPLRLLRLLAIVISTAQRAGTLFLQRVLIYTITMATLITSVCAVIVYHAEHHAKGTNIRTAGDAFWWAATTVTTVGYGDRYPITPTGRVTAFVLMIVGIALVGSITATVAAAFVNVVRGRPHNEEMEAIREERGVLIDRIDGLVMSISNMHVEVSELRAQLTNASTHAETQIRSRITDAFEGMGSLKIGENAEPSEI